MKMEVFSNLSFFTSLNKLMVQDGISIKTGYRLKTMKELLGKELGKYEELRKDLVEKYATKDEKNEVLRKPEGNAVFTEENEKLFTEKFKELQNVEFDIGPKIKLAEIESAKSESLPMKPQDLVHLSDLLEE